MLFWGFLFAMSRKVSCSWIAGSRWSTSARVVWTSPPEGHLLSGHLRVFFVFFWCFLFIKNHWVTFEESCSRFFSHQMSQKSVIFGWIQHKNGSMFYSFFRNHFRTISIHFICAKERFALPQRAPCGAATAQWLRGRVDSARGGVFPRSWIKVDHWDLGFQHITNSPGALHIPYYRHL